MGLASYVFKPALSGMRTYQGGKSKPRDTRQEVHKMSSNENPFGASPLAMKALREAMEDINEYPPQTDVDLRQKLAEFYQQQLSADQFITGNGGVGILATISHAFLGADTSCIASNPCFLPYIQFSEKVGATVYDIPLKGSSYELDVQGVLAAIRSDTRVLWLCSPNNPTGTYIPKSTLDTLIPEIPDHVVVVYDEVYYQYADAPDYARGLDYVLQGYNVIAINSFSKSYGLAGLRVGYAYATREIADYINKTQRPFLINTLSLNAAIGALDDDVFIRETLASTHQGKRQICRALDEMKVKYWPSQTNFIMMDPQMPSLDFELRMAALGVMVRRADGFGAPGMIRVTVGTTANNCAFIQACEEVLLS